jgi:outer membrane receptor for ferrienterochelin and colicins
MNKGFLVIFLFLFTLKNYSQNLTGIISSNNKSVSFSTINIKEPALVTTSDIDGKFSFKLKKPGTYKLSVSSLGYKKENITVEVNDNNKSINIELKPLSYELNQVVITGTMKESFISASPVKVDVLTMKFMEKIATSNVMETIENVNGVQKQVNCGVCGTNDIHLNGMEGPYTLVLIDGMPIMSSLSTVYGLNGISTSLIKQIEIVKGPSSTLYGTEALAGVINIITKDANDVSLLEFDIFGTSHLEKNIDFSFAPKSERLNVLFSGNAYFMKNFLDDNKDLFSDIPLS